MVTRVLSRSCDQVDVFERTMRRRMSGVMGEMQRVGGVGKWERVWYSSEEFLREAGGGRSCIVWRWKMAARCNLMVPGEYL